MKILMVSDSETVGGAAVCASRLAESLCSLGHEVVRFLPVRDRRQAPWKVVISKPGLWEKALYRVLPQRLWSAIAENQRAIELRRAIRLFNPDIINVHNIHSARSIGWSVELVKAAVSMAPVVWTLHDMWSMTGGCAYSNSCTLSQSGCSQPCEWTKTVKDNALYNVSREWLKKRDILTANKKLVAVSPSHWLAEEAKKGLWARNSVEVIPYGLPTDIYLPIEKHLARSALGIDGGGPVLLVVAQRLNDPRKGLSIFFEAINLIKTRPLRIITMGDRGVPFQADGVKLIELGWVDNERMKVLAYSAADLFVHTSLADNLPNVILESFTCGTPVVAFSNGGVPELVKDGNTGFLSDSIRSDSLASLLSKALASDQLATMGVNCRRNIVQKYGALLQAERYLALFNEIISTQ